MTARARRPANRSELPAYILRVAGTLFRTQGYARVTMEQVADRAAVSKRTLYKYFPAREALLERLLEDTLAADLAAHDLSAHRQVGFRAGAAALLHASARWCGRHTDVLLPYIRYKFASFDPRALPAQDRGLLPVWTAMIDAAQRTGELSTQRPPEQLAMYFHYLYLGALMRWLVQPELDLRSEFDTVVGLFMDGARKRGT